MELFDYKDIAIVNRDSSGFAIYPDRTIIITSDFIKKANNKNTSSITIDGSIDKINVVSESVLLESFKSKLNKGESYSVVYGEKLLDLLEWIIGILKTHSHGPNSPAIPDFHFEADEWMRDMRTLINDKVRTR